MIILIFTETQTPIHKQSFLQCSTLNRQKFLFQPIGVLDVIRKYLEFH